MIVPQINRFGCALPIAWQKEIVRRSRVLDLAAIASDLLLDYPPDDRGFDAVTTKQEFFLIEQIVARYFRPFFPLVASLPSPASVAQRVAEAIDGCGGGRPGFGEDGIDRTLDVHPRLPGSGGDAPEGSRGLAPLRLQRAQVAARVLAQLANAHPRVALERPPPQ
jgi:hypothetical protein